MLHVTVRVNFALLTNSSEHTLSIEKLVYGGDGLARLDGRVVLTPFVLPGEIVKAEVAKAKSDLLRGRLIEVVTPAPGRIEPRCPYFMQCGGCQHQHSTYELQLEQKRTILREVLRRVGKIEFDGEIGILSGPEWQYRNRVQLHIHQGKIGYFQAGSHELTAIDHCPISSPRLNEAIGKLARELPGYRGFSATVELFTNETGMQVNVLDRVPHSIRPLFEELGTAEPLLYDAFRVSRFSFFQVNRFLIDALCEAAIGDSSGESAVDLYAGVGLFAAALGRGFRNVTAAEPSASAFRDLESNVKCITARKTAEEFLAGLEMAPDLILADPPRAGLGKIVTTELVRLKAPQLTIVACDPATLARDLRVLLGSYRIDRITMVDLFPQTAHLETVVHLRAT